MSTKLFTPLQFALVKGANKIRAIPSKRKPAYIIFDDYLSNM